MTEDAPDPFKDHFKHGTLEIREEVRVETLPPDVRKAMDQMIAALRDMEQRLAAAEKFQSALIREATTQLKATG